MTEKNKFDIQILRKEKVLASFPAFAIDGGAVVKVQVKCPEKVVLRFVGTPRKPAMKMAFEAVMIHADDYDPQTDRVTIEQPDETGPEGF